MQLPDGVERYSLSIRNRLPALSKQPFGKVVLVSDLPAIIAQERERWEAELEIDYLKKETGFEPGQQREGGLPGEEATLVDHVLQEFVKAGAKLAELGERLKEVEAQLALADECWKKAEAERDQAKAQALAELREEIEALPRYEDTRGPLVAGRLIERKAVLYILDQEDQLDRLDRAEGEGRR